MSEGVFFFEDEPHSLAPRLFRLPPAGTGGDAESLASYVKRMAHKHRMAPRGFVEEYVSPSEPTTDSIELQRDWLHRNGQDLIGVSDRAGEMADWFERNAGVSGLRSCTLTSLARFACGQKLITRQSRVCLECFAEDRRDGRPMFERLLWRMEPVSACDRHRRALVTPCCRQERAKTRFAPPKLPGICSHCGSIGQKCGADEPAPECTDADIWVAEQCRRLVEALPSLVDADPIRMKEALRTHWTATAGTVFAAKEVGMVKSSLSAWVRSPTAKCTLFRLTDIALTQQLDLVAMLRGEILPCAGPAEREPRTRKRVLRRADHAAVNRRLKAALAAGESAAQVAREMRVSLCTLSQHKELYRQVTEQARTARERQATARRSIAVQEAEQIAIRLLKKGRVPSLRNASAESGVKWLPSALKSCALASIRVRLGDNSVRLPPRSGGYSAELKQMLDESAERIRHQLE